MTIYVLIHEQDTDSAWGADVNLFLDVGAARASMRASYEATVRAWGFDESIQTEEHEATCNDEKAVIRDDSDVENWRIEEASVDVEMAIRVRGGQIQAIYANADVSPDVYDLDVSDFPDEGEQETADDKEAELEQRTSQPGWRAVW